MGKNLNDGKNYAVKILNPDTNYESNLRAFTTEAKILNELNHPNIVKLHEHGLDGVLTEPNGTQSTVVYSVLELASGGEIFDWVKRYKRFSEPVALFFFKQLLAALRHCHQHGYSHSDIKLENLLLDENLNLILADFGFSTSLAGEDGNGFLTTFKGTENYMAPELHSFKPYNGSRADLFSAGVTLFTLAVGHPPFRKAVVNDVTYKYFYSNRLDLFWKQHAQWNKNVIKSLSNEFKSLIACLLAVKPVNRASLSEVQAHPWCKGKVATLAQVVEEFSE